MLDQRNRSLILLSRVQAALSGLIAVIIFAVYGISPEAISNTGASMTNAVLGAIAVAYFISLHQIIGRKRLALSTLLLTLITSLNFVLVIATTGGLDSPYYSLWLLAIVVAGIFGRRETFITLGITLAYFIYVLIETGFNGKYLSDHIVQLAITVIAGGLAEWVHSRSRKANFAHNKLEDLSGQLNAEQLKAQALVASIGEGVIVINGSRQIQLFNKAAQQLTGWDENSAQGIDYNLVLLLKDEKDQDVTPVNNPFDAAWDKHQQVTSDNLFMTSRDGHKIALNLSISPIMGANNTVNGAIALFRDISHEKAVERQKDEFVSTASHEMRTPVAAIEGYISLAMNPNIATIDERAMNYLNKAHDSIQHLGELFRDLLSVTKAEEGSLQMKIEPLNLSELLQSVIEDMQFVTQKKHLNLTYQVSSSAGKAVAPLYYVAANPERLREVVMNLIDNAIKFTAEGGVIVSLTGNDKLVQVDVSDTGLGISNEDIPHLFQKFYRIDSSATRTIGGTGLGLYLCRTVIEFFNGRVWVTSKSGRGSTFHIELPRLSASEVDRINATGQAGVAQPSSTPGQVVQPNRQPQAGPAISAQPLPMPVPGELATDTGRGRRIN
jgi:PAS domain S-box-containing protein